MKIYETTLPAYRDILNRLNREQIINNIRYRITVSFFRTDSGLNKARITVE